MKSTEKIVREYRQEQAKDGPAERWRKPVKPVTVTDDQTQAWHDGNVLRTGYNATFDDETIERFRVGRACLRCWEPQEIAFPEACPLCGYGMRELQVADFEKEFEGAKWVGPTTSLSDEYERMLLDGQRRRHKPGSSILVPDDVPNSSGIILPRGVNRDS